MCFILDLTIKADNKPGPRRLAISIGIRNTMNCIRCDIYPIQRNNNNNSTSYEPLYGLHRVRWLTIIYLRLNLNFYVKSRYFLSFQL